MEGQAGMAVIVDTEKNLDLKVFAKELQNVLPAYARPIFIRFANTLDVTGTYKLRKIDFRICSFEATKTKDLNEHNQIIRIFCSDFLYWFKKIMFLIHC